MRTSNIRRRQGGAIVIVVALSLTLLVACMALVLDLGRLYIAKAELQNAADAAALAAAIRLNGTPAGVTAAVDAALSTAGENAYWGNRGETAVVLARGDVTFEAAPVAADSGSWQSEATASASPATYFFVKVDTNSRSLDTWFAPILHVFQTSASGVAVAGRYPPNSLNPLFIPIVRRNLDQADPGDAIYPWCNGRIYDPKTFKKDCPTAASDYLAPDSSGNWGFLKPGETRNGQTGSFYVITPVNSNALQPWTVSSSWKGNIGYMLGVPGDTTQKAIVAALCQGGSNGAPYGAPGCGAVHTGNMSGKLEDALDTRFDMASTAQCPADANVKDFAAYYNVSSNAPYPPATYPRGFYLDGYAKDRTAANYRAPAIAPPGVPNRRLIRAYVADNAWLPGYSDGRACTSALSGSSDNAHLVGCAEFFMWTKADKSGTYVEYVGRVPNGECSKVGSFSAVRLYE